MQRQAENFDCKFAARRPLHCCLAYYTRLSIANPESLRQSFPSTFDHCTFDTRFSFRKGRSPRS